MPTSFAFKTIGIVGLGLIGGSFAKAFAAKGIVLYGYDKSSDTLRNCAVSGIFEGLTDDLDDFLDFKLDLIYICLPAKAAVGFIKLLGERGVSTPVTDAVSVKADILAAASQAGLNFCGGHPIKGKETSGFEAAEKDLFNGARHILVSKDEGGDFAQNLRKLHELIGMRVSFMSESAHDRVFAYVSHLPHVIAFSLVDVLLENNKDAIAYAAGGFKDFTRIAASDSTMWADIFCANSHELVKVIEDFEEILAKWKKLIKTKKREKLLEEIDKVSSLRKSL